MGTIESNSPEVASKFKTQPYNHQLHCLNKYGRMPYFALLAEQGTGKTWIIINNIADLWSSGDCDALIVFAPNGVHSNWTRLELPKHMPDWVRWKAADWVSGGTKKEMATIESLYDNSDSTQLRIFTMNWEALQTKAGFEAAQRFANTALKLCIVADESDGIKNPAAIRTKALMKLKKYSKWRRIMTGTPINNAPFDAFSQYSFLDESILGTTSYYAFKAEYAELLTPDNHIMRNIAGRKAPKLSAEDRQTIADSCTALYRIIASNGRAELTDVALEILQAVEADDHKGILAGNERLRSTFSPAPSEKKGACLRLMQIVDNILSAHIRKTTSAMHPRRLPQIVGKDKAGRPKYRNLDKLSRLIEPVTYRVLKSDCLDLPKKIYQTLYFDLTPQQKQHYWLAQDMNRLALNGEETPFNKLVAATKLSQIVSGYYHHPFQEEVVRIEGENPKLDLLVEQVNKIREADKKIIVWARYTTQIEDIVKRLEAEGHKVVQYYGAIGKKERVQAIEDFERGDAGVFVGNQQAGGTGITLVAASYVIYFSNNFSLRDRLQSEDRAHRIGQKEDVTYINIIGKDTIEETIVYAIENKLDIAQTIIDHGLKKYGDKNGAPQS